MWFTTRKEIEYLNAIDLQAAGNRCLVDELSRRLDAVRRYDQHYCAADWHPSRIMSVRTITADFTQVGKIREYLE
jgi:hypothetical protein